jgi:hypothetical protein
MYAEDCGKQTQTHENRFPPWFHHKTCQMHVVHLLLPRQARASVRGNYNWGVLASNRAGIEEAALLLAAWGRQEEEEEEEEQAAAAGLLQQEGERERELQLQAVGGEDY